MQLVSVVRWRVQRRFSWSASQRPGPREGCLAEQPAFSGEHVMAVLAKILVESPPPVAELGVQVQADVERVVW